MAAQSRWLTLITTFLLLSWMKPTISQRADSQPCSRSYVSLETSLLSNSENRVNLLKAFFPPKASRPVFVTVTYTFGNSTNDSVVWYWSESEFYLIQPLEIFQFTSLFFANMAYRQRSVDLVLDTDCEGASHDLMELLTQRLKLYSQSPTVAEISIPARINDDYIAVAASREDVESDSIASEFANAWLHLIFVLFPICSAILLYVCDPVQLLLGDKTWQKLEDHHNHPTIAALIQISVIFTMLVFMLDWFGFMYTIKGDFITYDRNAAFYLSVLTGLVVDTVAFVWVIIVIATSCHWDCKQFWLRWRRQEHQCKAGSSDKIKKLMSTIMFAPLMCVANHFHYIALAWISDAVHAGSIAIAYFTSFLIMYFVFRQFYARVALRPSKKRDAESDDMPLTNGKSTDTHVHLPPCFNTQVVAIGLMFMGPLIILYLAIIIILFMTLPIRKSLESSPTTIYTIYQGTGILIVALLTYNIILRPNPFSLAKVIEKIASEVHVSERGSARWNRLSVEEKGAIVVSELYHVKRDNQKPAALSPELINSTEVSIKVETQL